MANQAFLSIWLKDLPEETMLQRWGDFLGTIPFSETQPGFTYLEVRAVDSSETPVLEQDLRSLPLDAPSIIEMAKPHLHSDSNYMTMTKWDLWSHEGEPAAWKQSPKNLVLACNGPDFDDKIWEEDGHFAALLGLEHYFTGHGGLLGVRQIARPEPQSPEEALFLESMNQPANLQMYQEKTRDNIKKLFDWVGRIEKAIPAVNVRIWSEGEENLEARLDEILAIR
jgi:hypothetical protein